MTSTSKTSRTSADRGELTGSRVALSPAVGDGVSEDMHQPRRPRPPRRQTLSGLGMVIAAGLLSVGCGDLSQEDLLFRAGIPTKQAVAVVPPGSEQEVADEGGLAETSQALEERCDGNLLCESRNISRNFNGLTFFLLDLIDTVTTLQPSKREVGRRVWGPFYDRPKDQTYRFEMTREEGATFRFCLHASEGQLRERDAPYLTCDTADDTEEAGGFINVFSGTFSPSGIAGDAARQGQGQMHLESAALNRLNREARFADSLDFTFDNTNGTNIVIDVNGAGFNAENRDARYEYVRDDDDSGEMHFELFANMIRGGGLFEDDQLEHVSLDAIWQSDRAGRAHGTVDGGDAEDRVFTIEQCWGSELALVYDKAIDDTATGDEGQCAFDDVP